MITPKNRYTAFKEAILNAPSETHCWPFSEKYSEGEVGELLKSVLESTEGQCIEGSEHLVHHVKVASELNRCYKDYYQMMQSLFSKTDLDGLDLSDDEQRLFVARRNMDGYTQIDSIKYDKDRTMLLSEVWTKGMIGGLPDNF